MIRILSSARGKALLGLVLLLCLLAGALLFWQTDAGDSAHYTLVGEGYVVQVNQKHSMNLAPGNLPTSISTASPSTTGWKKFPSTIRRRLPE